jgi:NitT/TauT family transport system permease protein
MSQGNNSFGQSIRFLRWGPSASKDRYRYQRIVLPLVSALGFLAAWELAVDLFNVPEIVLPAPSQVVAVFFDARFALLVEHAVPTSLQTVLGFLLSALLGFLTAISLSFSALWREAVYPYLIAFQVIPKIALAPLFTVLFGLGFLSQIAFIVFISFFPIVVATATGLANANRDAVRLCSALNASRAQTVFLVRLPYAVDYLFSGLKIASTMAVIGVVVGEFISSKSGLAYLILKAASRLEMDFVIAAIIAIVIVGLLLYGAVLAGEAFVKRWLGVPT